MHLFCNITSYSYIANDFNCTEIQPITAICVLLTVHISIILGNDQLTYLLNYSMEQSPS